MRWAMRRFAGEESARDLVGGEPADQAKRQRRARLGGQHRMAGNEDEAQKLIADIVVHGGFEVLDPGIALTLEVAADLLVLAREHPVAADAVDGAALGRGHQPGAGIVRDAGPRPFGQRDHAGILRQLFCQADVAHHPGQARDEPGPFDPEDRLDCLMGFGRRHLPRLREGAGATQAAAGTAGLSGRPSFRDCGRAARRPPGSRPRRSRRCRRPAGSRSRSGRASDWDSASPTRPPRPGP